MLAEPNLVAINGKEASFLAGGEFPVPVVQAGASAGAITVQYSEFGIRLSFVPQVHGAPDHPHARQAGGLDHRPGQRHHGVRLQYSGAGHAAHGDRRRARAGAELSPLPG